MITTGSKSNGAYETCVYQPTRSTRNLFRRMVQVLPNGPLLDYPQAFGEQELKAPNAAGTLGASWLRYALESHRRPKAEPAVTLRPEAHAKFVEWD